MISIYILNLFLILLGGVRAIPGNRRQRAAAIGTAIRNAAVFRRQP